MWEGVKEEESGGEDVVVVAEVKVAAAESLHAVDQHCSPTPVLSSQMERSSWASRGHSRPYCSNETSQSGSKKLYSA